MMWDPDLDEAFIQNGFRATDPENEVGRFALALRTSLMKPERRYGEGFFNAVLTQWVSRSPFAKRLADVLAEIHERDAPAESPSYNDCWGQIQAAIVARADDLTERLGWDEPRAADVLGRALGAYLDERFNVSNRRLLGLSSRP